MFFLRDKFRMKWMVFSYHWTGSRRMMFLYVEKTLRIHHSFQDCFDVLCLSSSLNHLSWCGDSENTFLINAETIPCPILNCETFILQIPLFKAEFHFLTEKWIINLTVGWNDEINQTDPIVKNQFIWWKESFLFPWRLRRLMF